MNENEKNVTEVQEVQTKPQPEKVLSAEEALAERERLVAEREKAIEHRERTEYAKKSLSEKGLPAELSEFVTADNDEQSEIQIQKLYEIFKKSGCRFPSDVENLPIVNTGGDHNRGTSPSSAYQSDFIRGLNY